MIPVSRKRFRILLIDDDPAVRDALARLLGSHHEVQVASGAAEALLLVAGPTPFEAIICDVLMPGLNGADFHDAIEPGLAERLVFLTGGGLEAELARRLERSGRPVLAKPASLSEIETLLAELAAP